MLIIVVELPLICLKLHSYPSKKLEKFTIEWFVLIMLVNGVLIQFITDNGMFSKTPNLVTLSRLEYADPIGASNKVACVFPVVIWSKFRMW